MARLFFITVVALSLAGLVFPKPTNQAPLQPDGTVHTAEGWGYQNCGLEADIVQIESIEVSPDPPKPGQDLTVKVKAHVTNVIEEGAYADVTVKLGLIKILQKRFDICQEARSADAEVKCPVQPDSYIIQQTVALPKEIPKAKFSVAVRGYTADDDDMVCLDLKVDFMKNPFPRLGW